jgi:hypothetical protein
MARTFRLAFLLGIAALVIFQNSAFGNDSPKPCSPRDHLKIVSLSIYPDPLPDTKRVEEWLLRLRSDSAGECQTPIRIIEMERDIVAAETAALIKSGANEIKLAPAPDYRFTANERCFNVIVASEESKIKIDGPQAFCALRINNRWWTMR